jgi:tryptophan synthase beta chain
VAAGLDYTGIGPSTPISNPWDAWISARNRSKGYRGLKTSSPPKEYSSLEFIPCRGKGIEIAKKAKKDQIIVINVSGRGDKDIFIIAEALKDREWFEFLRLK